MKMILLGAPGAGKGTQAEILSKTLNIPTISTGNILRAAMKAGTPVGLQAKSYVEAGKLVPDEVIINIIRERLAEPDCANGYILDGVPRTIPQAEAMEALGIEIDTALSIEVEDSVIVERMGGRRTCRACGGTFHVVNNPPKPRDRAAQGFLRSPRQTRLRRQSARNRSDHRGDPRCAEDLRCPQPSTSSLPMRSSSCARQRRLPPEPGPWEGRRCATV